MFCRKNKKKNVWMKKYLKDIYVKKVKQNSEFRSRSWFKLQEIQKLDKIFKPNITIIDLGCSPGGWSKFVSLKIGLKGKIIACDLLPMKKINNVSFIQGNLCDDNIINLIKIKLNNLKAQVIMSDISPNISGIKEIDIPKSMYLSELALNLCYSVLDFNGNFLIKIFQGIGVNQYLKKIDSLFKTMKIRKPDASRSHSCEIYVVAKGYQNK
ncbi:23S rRNA (uridine(2552)-2'-O)-methyltransferase [Enterobacteriaceae endosymbiont of Plateumaris consimilis]|uniref:RlmE family RNA methyltransferase n=1 Tax=Enterobacteriaceae endosymbiont of Plateumaris consimilis TaxID=2675794 RepID=UPI001448B051|nr:SAM-dependent methyltransferase [Enterobacteriaceae endosymbiont of Plateumaris consimilis]QJC28719.1 23S rRNA (uridine(2552)-2'-O)-methyltransferase [Enterobacteriaceae endosymbiont of Plateumaris consimilis]